jgi:hypothetical protein
MGHSQAIDIKMGKASTNKGFLANHVLRPEGNHVWDDD